MAKHTPSGVTAAKKPYTRYLTAITLSLILVAAAFLIYVHDISVRKWFSFNERVASGYNLWISVSGAPCSVVLKPWGGGLLGLNVTEDLGWGQNTVVPQVADLNNGSTVLMNLSAGNGGLPFSVYTLTLNVYTPAVSAGNLSFNLQSCSFKATVSDARGVHVYVGLGDVFLNVTGAPHRAAYTVVTQTGDILMALPAGLGFTVNATTINGGIRLEGANLAALNHDDQNVYGEVGGGGSYVYLATVDGSITLETYPQSL